MAEKNTGPSNIEATPQPEDVTVILREAFEANKKLIGINDPRASKLVEQTLRALTEMNRYIKRLQLDRAKVKGGK